MRELRPEIEESFDNEDYLDQVICIIGFIMLAIGTQGGVLPYPIHPGILVVCTISLFIGSAMRWTFLGIFALPIFMLLKKAAIPPNLLIVLAAS